MLLIGCNRLILPPLSYMIPCVWSCSGQRCHCPCSRNRTKGVLPKSGGVVRAKKERETVRRWRWKRGGNLNVPVPMGLAQHGGSEEEICYRCHPPDYLSSNGADQPQTDPRHHWLCSGRRFRPCYRRGCAADRASDSACGVNLYCDHLTFFYGLYYGHDFREGVPADGKEHPSEAVWKPPI